MWLKLCFIVLYVLLLFVLARLFEALAWCELGLPGLPNCSSLNCRLLDPVLLSVAQLKALLDQRGLSYEGVVEKSELTKLVTSSGQVSIEDAEKSQMEELSDVETNFTSGAHFIEQVEDAKDSVWLVQVSGSSQHSRGFNLLGDSRWKSLKRKMVKFGVRMGHLDCSLDPRYCHLKGWHSNFVLLALPSQHQKKASVALYNFSVSPVRETALIRWVRDKLDDKIERIADVKDFTSLWQHLGKKSHLEPEVRVVFFTKSGITPLFYSALSVKFPGRVKFGLVWLHPDNESSNGWQKILNLSKISTLPAYVVYTAENNYTYGARYGEPYSFIGMERFLKTLYPCLNDIFINSFCLANAISWLEPFISNCGIIKRLKKFIWCVFKYNLMVILLWLPTIAVFQMPYLDQLPLLALKGVRMFSMSGLGQMLRGDYNYYLSHPIFLFLTFAIFVTFLTLLCKKFRSEEIDDINDWFNFSQMRTLTHLRPNDFFEPMRVGGYDLFGGLDVFGSRLSQPSLWLPSPVSPDYIQNLPTWKFCPVSLSERAQMNVKAMEASLISETSCVQSSEASSTSQENGAVFTTASRSSFLSQSSQSSTSSAQLNGIDQPMCKDETEGSCQCGKPTGDTKCKAVKMKTHNITPAKDVDLERLSCTSAINPNFACSSSHCNACQKSATPSRAHTHISFPQKSQHSNPCHSESVDVSCTSIKQEKSNFPAGYLESYQCVICLEEYAPLTSLCGLPCGHVFHETCIISWLNRDKHFCPMCRLPSYRPH